MRSQKLKEPCLPLRGLSCFSSLSNYFNFFFFFYWSDDVCLPYKEYSKKHLITQFLCPFQIFKSSRLCSTVSQEHALELRIIFDSRVFQSVKITGQSSEPRPDHHVQESRRRKLLAERGKARGSGATGSWWQGAAMEADEARGSWGSGAAGRGVTPNQGADRME